MFFFLNDFAWHLFSEAMLLICKDQVLGFGLFDVYVGDTFVLLKIIDDNS